MFSQFAFNSFLLLNWFHFIFTSFFFCYLNNSQYFIDLRIFGSRGEPGTKFGTLLFCFSSLFGTNRILA